MNRRLLMKVCFMSVCCVGLVLVASDAMAFTSEAASTAKEFDSTWDKAKGLIEGSAGKLASVAIAGVAVWQRERIGIPAMFGAFLVAIAVPSFPTMINTFSMTI